MNASLKKIIVSVIASVFIFLFVYTGLSKLMHFVQFQNTLSKSPMLHSIYNVIALLLPVIELVVAFLLLVPRTQLAGLYASFILMLVFTVYIGYMLRFEKNIPCSCGGILRNLTWTHHLQLNAALLVLSTIALFLSIDVTNRKIFSRKYFGQIRGSRKPVNE